jgi:ribose transport system substrate-binding protein
MSREDRSGTPRLTPRIATAVIAALLLAWGLTGCGDGGGGEGGTGAAPGEAGDRPRVGVAIPAATHGWPAGVIWWARRAMGDYPNIDWQFQTAGNATEQANQIEALVEKEIAALVVLPFDSDTPLPAVRRAKQRGVFVVSVDRGLREPVADVYVAGDNAAFGRKAAAFIAERLGGQGRIVVLRGMQVEIDTERYEAAIAELEQHPGIEVLGVEHGNWNRQDAHAVMQTFLTKFDEIDAVWAADDDMALGVEQAIREAGREGEMWIVGGGGMKQVVKRVMDEDPMYPATVTYPPGMIAAGIHLAAAHVLYEGNELAVADDIPGHLNVPGAALLGPNEASPSGRREIRLDLSVVTAGNAEQFYFPESVY